MKTLTILFLFVLVLPSYGRILTVSNMPDSPGQYTSMNDVIGAVISGAGDTIYVHGSPINYGTVFLSRDNIVVIGTGHNPDKQFPYVTTFTEIFVTGNNIQLIGITANRNPRSSSFTLDVYGDAVDKLQVDITDESGKHIETHVTIDGRIDLGTHWAPALYLVRIKNPDEVTVLKIVKIK